jgi:hypothetical protein
LIRLIFFRVFLLPPIAPPIAVRKSQTALLRKSEKLHHPFAKEFFEGNSTRSDQKFLGGSIDCAKPDQNSTRRAQDAVL